MEVPRDFEPNEPRSFRRKVIGGIIAGFHFVGHQLATSDQSPHPGRLLSDTKQIEQIQIPDYPPDE